MAFSLVNHVVGGSTTGSTFTTSSIDTTGATLLVLVLADYGSVSISAISDSKSNTWTALTSQNANVLSRCTIFYVASPTVGSGHTFTATRSLSYPAVAVCAFSGAKVTSPFDQENGATGNSNTSLATGSITPTEDNELIVSGLCTAVVNTYSINSSMTISDQLATVGGQCLGIGMAYKFQSSAAAINPTWSWSSTDTAAATIASFKAAAASTSKLAALGVG